MKACLLLATVGVVLVVCTALPSKVCDTEKGEEFTTCGSACPDTCDNYNEIRPCTMQCVIGCACPRDTVRRESDGYCVDIKDC